jgi:hypothetical protein
MASRTASLFAGVVARLGQLLGIGTGAAGAVVTTIGVAAAITSAPISAPFTIILGLALMGTGSLAYREFGDVIVKDDRPRRSGRSPFRRRRRSDLDADPHRQRNEQALRNADPDFTPNLDVMSPRKDPPGFRTQDDPRPSNYDARSTDFDTSYGGSGGGGDGGGGSLSDTHPRSIRPARSAGDFGL